MQELLFQLDFARCRRWLLDAAGNTVAAAECQKSLGEQGRVLNAADFASFLLSCWSLGRSLSIAYRSGKSNDSIARPKTRRLCSCIPRPLGPQKRPHSQHPVPWASLPLPTSIMQDPSIRSNISTATATRYPVTRRPCPRPS